MSPHFNLIVLYTADNVRRVVLAAAAAMRGIMPASPQLKPTEEVLGQARRSWSGRNSRKSTSKGSALTCSAGRRAGLGDLRQALQAAEIGLGNLKPLADHLARRWVQELFEGYEPEDDRVLELRANLETPETMWVQCGSCFVAVVGKPAAGAEEDEGAFVWRRLGEALRAWRPNFYRLVLSEIQNALELEAVADHETWLNDNLCLGLGLYLLESEQAATGEPPSHAAATASQSLIDRFIDIIRRRLASHDKITGTASTLLSARLSTPLTPAKAGENGRHVRARELAHVDPAANCDWGGAVIPAVNAFMVSDAFRGGHITTGSVLRSGEKDYWLCASPACDLEPRGKGPVVLQLIRLTVVNSASKFTTGEHIAITTDAGTKILQALSKDSRQPSLKVALLPSGTHVTSEVGAAPTLEGWFANGSAPDWPDDAEPATAEAVLVEPEAGNPAEPASAEPRAEPTAVDGQHPVAAAEVPPIERGPAAMAPTTFTVVAQLRGAFATRFLLAAGQHLSRIGVDFVDP